MITFSECISRINQTLNYPAYTYADISHFFDQAISELNTTFKIGLPLVSQMVQERTVNVHELPNLVILNAEPNGVSDFESFPKDPAQRDTAKAYYDADSRLFYKYNVLNDTWETYPSMYGIFLTETSREYYEASRLWSSAAWFPLDTARLNDFALDIYMPDDWTIMFLIPYVCFKTAVRDGMSGAMYQEEFIQGFQQLQTSYDVPNFVQLSTVAHLPAYTDIVKQNLNNLNIKVPVRAVYDSMKVGNAILPEYSNFYTEGGWRY